MVAAQVVVVVPVAMGVGVGLTGAILVVVLPVVCVVEASIVDCDGVEWWCWRCCCPWGSVSSPVIIFAFAVVRMS